MENKSDRLQEISTKCQTQSVFYGDFEYAGKGKLIFNPSESAKDDISYLHKLIQEQQKEIDKYKKALYAILNSDAAFLKGDMDTFTFEECYKLCVDIAEDGLEEN